MKFTLPVIKFKPIAKQLHAVPLAIAMACCISGNSNQYSTIDLPLPYWLIDIFSFCILFLLGGREASARLIASPVL